MSPLPKTDRKPVQVKFDPTTLDALRKLAEKEDWCWDYGGEVGRKPSAAEAVRRLVKEALAARDGTAPAALAPTTLVVEAPADTSEVSSRTAGNVRRRARRAGVDEGAMTARMLAWAAEWMPWGDKP